MSRGPACGCVYLPSRAGCEMWSAWDAETVAHDFSQMRAHGLEAVRFFVLWRDFEPAPGTYEPQSFARLRELVAIAARESLVCVPALLTIFMNGELLDLPWRDGRDLWRDPEMTGRARAFAARVASTLSDCENIFAYDIGDELVHVDLAACQRLSRRQARAWQQGMADAIRARHPGALVFQGCDASAIFGAHPFGVDNSRALDLLGVHTFPNWSPVPVDGVRDPLSSLLPGFLVRFARAFGEPIVDELGVYGVAPELAAGHLRAAGASALAAGAEALFAWCWQDILSASPPYDVRPHERRVGMLDAAGAPKSALGALRELSGLADRLAVLERPLSPIGVLVPELWRGDRSSYLDGRSSWPWAAFGAYVLLTQEKLPVEFVRSPAPHTRLLICPGATRLSARDERAIRGHVDGGGHLWCTTWTALALDGLADLWGGEPLDFTTAPQRRGDVHGPLGASPLDWDLIGPPVAAPTWEMGGAGTPHASFSDGLSAVWSRSLEGGGRAWFGQLPLELQPLSADGRIRRKRWGVHYAEAANTAGVLPAVECAERWVEAHAFGPRSHALVVNHAADPVATPLQAGDRELPLELEGKSWALVALEDDHAPVPLLAPPAPREKAVLG